MKRNLPSRTAALLLLSLIAAAVAPRASAGFSDASIAAPGQARRDVSTASAPADTLARSSADGVYQLDQANRGRDLFAGYCQSCHTPAVHAGPPFRKNWFGRSAGELFGYLRREMPKSDPGTMSDEDYSLVLAYILRINGMPTGDVPLATDSISLHRIRLDSVPSKGSALSR